MRKFVVYQCQFPNTDYCPNNLAGSQLVLKEMSTLCTSLSMWWVMNSSFCGIRKDIGRCGSEKNALQEGCGGNRNAYQTSQQRQSLQIFQPGRQFDLPQQKNIEADYQPHEDFTDDFDIDSHLL